MSNDLKMSDMKRVLAVSEGPDGVVRIHYLSGEPCTAPVLLGLLEAAKEAVHEMVREANREEERRRALARSGAVAFAARLGIPADQVDQLMREAHEETMREMAEELPEGQNVEDPPTPSRNL